MNFEMPNNPPKKDPRSDEIINEMAKKAQESLDERKKRLEMAKLMNVDKEPFDIKKFGEVYSLRGDFGTLPITPEVIFEYEEEYYVKNPDLKSMEEYARHRKYLDSHAAG